MTSVDRDDVVRDYCLIAVSVRLPASVLPVLGRIPTVSWDGRQAHI